VYSILKLVHVGAAILSISGFALRGYWMLTGSALLGQPLVRIAPHIVDTLFLLSGIGLIAVLNLPVLHLPWLLAKLVAVVVYILLGTVALKRGRTKTIRTIALGLATLTFLYIVGIALNKSAASWFALL
jgi:uncharacterized membrane protein SirB2